MRHRTSSSESGSRGKGDSSQEGVFNIRTKPPHIYDNITRRLLQLGITLGLTTFIGLIVRYAVKEFDPSVSTITVTTSRVDNRDIASLSVSKNFLERILEFVAESISIVGVIIPLGFPLCTLFNRYFAKIRAGSRRFDIKSNAVLSMIPRYLIIGDSLACHVPTTQAQMIRLRPLVRDTIYHLIRAHLKPKLIVEDSYEDARRLGIKIGLIRRDHHKLAVIKSVDLLKNITDSRGDIKQGKVRYLLSRMKIMSQSTPADKSLLIYLIKHCEPMPNENLAYLGYNFTDPEAMRLADCAMTFQDCDDDDVKRAAQIIIKSDTGSFTDIYLFLIVCLITSNITQSYALYQISASVSCCIYRFLCITVFQEQLLSHSQFVLLIIIQQVFAILALMTKWLSSLPQAQMRTPVAEMSHAATDETLAADLGGGGGGGSHHQHHQHDRGHHHQQHQRSSSRQYTHNRSVTSLTGATGLGGSDGNTSSLPRRISSSRPATAAADADEPVASGELGQQHFHQSGLLHTNKGDDDTLGSSSSLSEDEEDDNNNNNNILSNGAAEMLAESSDAGLNQQLDRSAAGRRSRSERPRQMSRAALDTTASSLSRHSAANQQQQQQQRRRPKRISDDEQPVHLSGADLDQAIINSKIATNYKQTFHNSTLIDDVTYRLAKLHIAYQTLVMIIIIIFGNAMFQLNMNNNRQHQTLALNSLIMNNIFNLANCFNQFGEFNLRSGFRNHPFFLCVLLLSVALQVCLTELNAFGLENLNPSQWFVCFVFALMSALIAPLTGQQRSQRAESSATTTTTVVTPSSAASNMGTTSHHKVSARATSGAGSGTLMNDMAAHHHHSHHHHPSHHHSHQHKQQRHQSSRASQLIASPSKRYHDNYM